MYYSKRQQPEQQSHPFLMPSFPQGNLRRPGVQLHVQWVHHRKGTPTVRRQKLLYVLTHLPILHSREINYPLPWNVTKCFQGGAGGLLSQDIPESLSLGRYQLPRQDYYSGVPLLQRPKPGRNARNPWRIVTQPFFGQNDRSSNEAHSRKDTEVTSGDFAHQIRPG